MPFEEYKAVNAVNQSSLKPMVEGFGGSPRAYKMALDDPQESTPAMELGTVIETCFLYRADYLTAVQKSQKNRGTKGFDADRAQYAIGTIFVTVEEYDMIELLYESFRANEYYETIMAGEKQPSLFWTDSETGLDCKARLDVLTDDLVIDIKKTRHVSEQLFWNDFAKLLYHMQFASYIDAAGMLDNKIRDGLVVVPRTEKPFEVLIYPVPDDAIQTGRLLYRSCLNKVRDCREVNAYPGLCEGVGRGLRKPSFPEWALKITE